MNPKLYIFHNPTLGYWRIENQIPSWTQKIEEATRFPEDVAMALPWMSFTHDPSNRWILVSF